MELFSVPEGDGGILPPVDDEHRAADAADLPEVVELVPGKQRPDGFDAKGGDEGALQDQPAHLVAGGQPGGGAAAQGAPLDDDAAGIDSLLPDQPPVGGLDILLGPVDRRPALARAVAAVVVEQEREAQFVEPAEKIEHVAHVLRIAMAEKDRLLRVGVFQKDRRDFLPAAGRDLHLAGQPVVAPLLGNKDQPVASQQGVQVQQQVDARRHCRQDGQDFRVHAHHHKAGPLSRATQRFQPLEGCGPAAPEYNSRKTGGVP